MDVATLAPEIELAYARGLRAALTVRHASPGLVRVEGGDRLDFLHRMSTNSLADLPQGRAIPTVLTTPLARIVDLVWVLNLDDQALLITSPGRGQTVVDWLNRYIFFQDDVRVSLVVEPGPLLGFYGPDATEAAQAAFPTFGSIKASGCLRSDGVLAWVMSSPALRGIRVLVNPDAGLPDDLKIDARSAGEAYAALRIEAGAPEFGSEIDAESIPLEVGLQDAISFTKGCYIGQEIIARMETRNRRARTLLGLRLEAPELAGASLMQDASVVGRMTSVTLSPRLGWIGLAVARPSALTELGGRVSVGESSVAGRLVELPLQDTPPAVPH